MGIILQHFVANATKKEKITLLNIKNFYYSQIATSCNWKHLKANTRLQIVFIYSLQRQLRLPIPVAERVYCEGLRPITC